MLYALRSHVVNREILGLFGSNRLEFCRFVCSSHLDSLYTAYDADLAFMAC